MSTILKNWWLVSIAAAILIANFYSGFVSVGHSQFASDADVFFEFMGGPLRLLFPLLVALLVCWNAAAELTHRHIAATRPRIEIRRHIGAKFVRGLAGIFALFFAVGMATWLCAFVIVPHLYPHAVDPRGYGLHTAASVLAATVKQAPLAALLSQGTLAFGVAASLWLGLNAVVFAAVGLVAVYILSRPIVALFVPFGVYIVESIVLQVAGFPGGSFLLSAVYPGGLQSYPLAQALVPSAVLAALAATAIAILLATARTNTRFS